MSLTGKDVAEIARLLDQSRFTELKLEIGDFRLRICRDGQSGGGFADAPPPPIAAPDPAPLPVTSVPAAGEQDVPAPFLGTFYHAPRPGDPPFVEPGQKVREDTVIGIIEVMKLMNPIRAGVAGTVVAVLAPNGAAVEAGQPLIRVAV